MSKLLTLLFITTLFFNTTNGNFRIQCGHGESTQSGESLTDECNDCKPNKIPEKEQRRIAKRIGRGIGIILPNISKGSVKNTNVPSRNRTNKISSGRLSNNVQKNPQPLRTSYVSQQTIKSYARKYGVNETRFYNLIIKESGGNVYARSPSGEYEGLAQWYKPYYNNQSRAWGYTPNIYNANQHLEVTARAISEGQEFRWQTNY